MFGEKKRVRSECGWRASRAFAALVFAIAFLLIVPGGVGSAAACPQGTPQTYVTDAAASSVTSAFDKNLTSAAFQASISREAAGKKITHCCGGTASSCAAGFGACTSCCLAAPEQSFIPDVQGAGCRVTTRARDGLAALDPAPDFRPPRLIS